jgi:cytochrome P450
VTTTSAGVELDQIDLSDADDFESGPPHRLFEQLRAQAPVHLNRSKVERDFWSVTRYEDVMAVTQDNVTFASGRPIAFMHDENSILPIPVLQGMMINKDAPDHSRYRKVVRAAFTPGAMQAFAPQIQALCTELVDGVVERGECDFVDDVAIDLPIAAVMSVLGMPDADRRQVFEWTNKLVGAQDPNLRGSQEELFAALAEIGEYTAGLVADRQQHPREDLMTRIVNAEVEGERLTFEEVVSFVIILMGAGNETSRNSLSLGLRALIEHPDQRQKLIDDPSLIPNAVEEVFRWVTPLMHFRRTATCDTEIAGQAIAEGDKVIVWYSSANRDESAIDRAGTFDVTRSPKDRTHAAFGNGVHKCLGQHLGRLTLQTMYRELLTRIPDMELTGDVSYMRSNLFHGLTKMPVAFTPGRRSH